MTHQADLPFLIFFSPFLIDGFLLLIVESLIVQLLIDHFLEKPHSHLIFNSL